MPWVFNPFTGKLDQTAASGGGGSSYDQSLNTTDNVTFNNVSIISTDSSGTFTYYKQDPAISDQVWAQGIGGYALDPNVYFIGNAASAAVFQLTATGDLSITGGFNSVGNIVTSGTISATNIGAAASKGVPATGNATSTQVVLGSDTRLTDNRTPTAHTHAATDITSGTLSDSRLSTNVLLLTGAQTITGTKTLTPAAGSSALIASNVTHTTSAPILDLTQTWNASAVAFSALKLSVTNTASAAASTLLDLSVGGTSQLHVTPAKQIRLFNSRSDASNYECAVMDWTTNSNALTLGTQKAGTGTARRVRLNSAENIDYYISDSTRVFQMATGGNTSFNPMNWQYYSGAGDPTTSTTPWNNGSSYCALWRNTTTGVVKLWVNNAGTMVSVALA